jgi:uncharacterized protein YggE
MRVMKTVPILFVFAGSVGIAVAQQPGQPQFKIDSTNRTLSVSALETVSVEPEVAILHIGFSTQPNDAKAAYAEGARTSNAIIDAVKQAGVSESDIRSERQYLDRDWSTKQHKYRLTQQWTVRVSPERAAEVLDTAINVGATSSGEIEWTVKDEKALEKEALDKAAERSRENAAVLAKGMNVRLGNLIYVTNELSGGGGIRPRMMAMAGRADEKAAAPPLAIEPQKVTRSATVYAVFAIE